MKENNNHLNKIQQDTGYQLLLRECTDRAAQGFLTLLVTINVGAFVTIIELLEEHYWLLFFFTTSTITALFSRIGIFYIYRKEIDMFEFSDNKNILMGLEKKRNKWWWFTEKSAWISLSFFTIGVILLTYFFIVQE